MKGFRLLRDNLFFPRVPPFDRLDFLLFPLNDFFFHPYPPNTFCGGVIYNPSEKLLNAKDIFLHLFSFQTPIITFCK